MLSSEIDRKVTFEGPAPNCHHRVLGFDAPVFLVVAGGVGATFASLGVTPGVRTRSRGFYPVFR
jgi:hypothetical protein